MNNKIAELKNQTVEKVRKVYLKLPCRLVGEFCFIRNLTIFEFETFFFSKEE